MYVSLKDVAARAGVSFQTASKVLNGRAGVASAATVERIETAARELGYVPNLLARGLVRRSSITVGILVDDVADTALSRFVAGAQRALAANGHAAVLVALHPDVAVGASLAKLLAHRVDGVLVIAPSLEDDGGTSVAMRDGLPLASLNHLPGTSAILLGSDHRMTGTLAGRHLTELGHREIATVTGPPSRQVVRVRLDGFRRALAEADVDLPDVRIEPADWTAEDAYTAAGRLLDSDPTITAWFAQNDTMAMGVLRLLADRKVRVPEHASVIGCDDLPMAQFLVPSLSTVHIPFVETGARAAAVLLDKIAGNDVPSRELLPVYLVPRASTARPPRARARAPAQPRAPAVRAAARTSQRRSSSTTEPRTSSAKGSSR
ncbi:MAG TPA: LacI family DNA-binding transcriptional regulator [Jatrophihabitantaceae bacterium]